MKERHETCRSIALLVAVAIFALLTDHAEAAGQQSYVGAMGDAPAVFSLTWEESGNVLGRCEIQNGGAFQLIGSNYAEGKLTLKVFSDGQQVGTLELGKQITGKVINWVGAGTFNDGSAVAIQFSRASRASTEAENKSSTRANGPMSLVQPNLVRLPLNPSLGDQPRPEVSSFAGADCVLLDEPTDSIFFANGSGKIERYSISDGKKFWSAHLPAGLAINGLYLGSRECKCLYAICVSANEVIHQVSIWSLPLDGIGHAEEVAQFWGGGSESSDPGAGADVAGHYEGSDNFAITYVASAEFNADDLVGKAAGEIYGALEPGQTYKVNFDARNQTLRRPASSPHKTLNEIANQGDLIVCRSEGTRLFACRDGAQSISVYSDPSRQALVRTWTPPETSLFLNTATSATLRDKSGQSETNIDNLVDLLTTARRTPSDSKPNGVTKSESGEENFVLAGKDINVGLAADVAGGEISLTDSRTGEELQCGGQELLSGVTYGSNIVGCWIDSNRALLCFSTGYFLLEKRDGSWAVRLIRHQMLPIAEKIVSGKKPNEALISSGDAIYYADVGSDLVTMRKAVFIGRRSASFALLSDNYYCGSPHFLPRLSFVGVNKAYPFEQFDLRLNRPDIVLERLGAPDEVVSIAKQLREKRLKRMGVTEEMLKPDFHVPELEIVGDVPSATDGGEINLSIKASDSKYPLERLKVYVNNVPVNGRDGELLRDGGKTETGLLGRITGAFSEASTGPQALERTIPIKLAEGRNKIQVSVLNNAGAESLYANAEVNCTAKRPKPTLYAVAMGVSEYSNPDWNLKYAAKDAQDVMARLKSRAGDNYSEVKELLLTDKEVTKETIAKIRDFLSGATIDDTVLVFVAGHGLLDSKYDYYFGTTDIDFNNPGEAGIPFEEFDDLLADLPSLKKSLLIDTCHAGELDDDEKTLLASAGGVSAPLPASNGIAMRSIGTRGMNVKAVEGARGASEWYDRLQGLFVDLRRGSGSTILSSSAGAEYALESSEQQNGLFTYAVLEALDGNKDADTNKDGSVQMSELGEYVKKRVSELTNNKQTPNTRRVNLEGDFTLAKTK